MHVLLVVEGVIVSLAHTLAGKTDQASGQTAVVVPRVVPVHRSWPTPHHVRGGLSTEWHGNPGDDTMISTATSRVLSRTVAHLESACALACTAAGSDLLSPWANTAMSIHLATAGPSVHLRACVPSAGHRDCLTALRAAQAELTRLPADHGLPLVAFAMVRSSLARALADVQGLQAHRCRGGGSLRRPQHPDHAR